MSEKNPSAAGQLIMIRGNSSSGKSSLARMLQQELGRGTLVISQDVVRREMLWAHDDPENPSLPLMMNLVQYGKKHNDYVILEGILNSEVYGDLFRCVQAEYAPENIHAYYYDIPFGETLRRRKTRPAWLEFGEEDMRRWWKEKDYIGFLPETVIPQEMSLSETVDMVLKDLGIAPQCEI